LGTTSWHDAIDGSRADHARERRDPAPGILVRTALDHQQRPRGGSGPTASYGLLGSGRCAGEWVVQGQAARIAFGASTDIPVLSRQ